MDVSVIFATHNRQDVLGDVFEAWRKVDAVTKYSYEIICSDDESTDDTVRIIENTKDLPIKLIRNKKGGASKARNAALKIAKGKIIIFTGDDIFPTENYINQHFENYLKYGDAVATLGRIEWHPDIKLNHLMKHITEIGCEQFGFIALPVYQFTDFRHFYTSNISVPAKLLNKLDKNFDTSFDKYGFEDIELGYRLEKMGMKIYYDPDILAYHHHIYDSVEKFCDREISAGEELVVFGKLHTDLYDKCNCDIENCTNALNKYVKKNGYGQSLKGKTIQFWCERAKQITKRMEKKINKNISAWNEKTCSYLYIALFRIYFYYGVVKSIARDNDLNISESQIYDFALEFMNKPIHEIYWNTGFGFSEVEARRWVCWNNDKVIIKQTLPANIQQIRISPLKTFCVAKIDEIYFVTTDGKKVEAKIEWHNACDVKNDTYDFTNTNDPCILIEDIPKKYNTIIVEMSVEEKKRQNIMLKTMRNIAGKAWRKLRYKQDNGKKWNAGYAYGQRRRIQIGIIGNYSPESKKELIKQYRNQVQILGEDVKISDAKHMEAGYINYLYDPQYAPFDITQMLQVAYTLLNEVVDYVLVSKSYIEFPQIACKDIKDVIVYNANLVDISDYARMAVAKGRYMRLPAYEIETNTINISTYWPNIKLNKEYYLGMNEIEYRISERVFGKRKNTKPIIFVVPVFLAVGGVERNTIEVMRCLKEYYDFCLITIERHVEQQGSLHYQLQGICNYIFDLKEITEHQHFLETMNELKKIFRPELMWLCNNSPWFEHHTAQIREIFSDIPIVAQDVYDTKVGWIEYYKNAEVKTFNRFIAINKLIEDTFIEEYQLPKEKIDLIYPVVDDKHIRKVKKMNLSYEAVCEKYGLDKKKEHYSYIARLTEQKNPLRYLEFVKKMLENGTDEIQFIMVGDGIYKEKVDEYVKKNNLQDQLIRIPYVSNVPELMSALNGLIVTSVYEGMPIVCIEAMSMGVPIFSTDSGDTKRFVEKNQCGLIIDETKSDVNNFTKFHNNLALYKKNAMEHAEEMLEFFSIKNVSEQYYYSFNKAKAEMKK